MNILVTGAKGMVGTALVNNLKNIRDGKNRTRDIEINEIYVAEATSYGIPINMYDSKSAGAESYRNLAKEIIARKDI